MTFTDNSVINILNYEGFASIPSVTNQFGISLREGTEDLPSITPVSFIDIKSCNSQSDIFKIGRLRFEDNVADDIYKMLFIDKRELLYTDEIKDILINPTVDKLQKIIDVKSLYQITRIRGIMYELKRSDDYEITDRVQLVVEGRYDEINNGRYNSQISIQKTRQERMSEQKEEIMKQAMSELLVSEKEKMLNELESEKEKIKRQFEEEYKKKLEEAMKNSLNEQPKTSSRKKTN